MCYAQSMANKRRFTPKQDSDIAALYVDKGLTMDAIAARYVNASVNSVRNSLLRSNVTIRPKNSPRPDEDWPVCSCGGRVIYKTAGQCASCYHRERNRVPEVREAKFTWWLRKAHGMSREAYDAMLAAQDGVCAICRSPDPRGHRLAVDHDHACCPGEGSACSSCIRGLLCVSCNTALGSLHDDVRLAEALIAYLKHTRSNHG